MSSQGPCVHSVQFYDVPESLITRLCGVVRSGLSIGNSVVIVARKSNRDLLISTLDRLEIDVRQPARESRFVLFDAAQLMDMFMVDGMPDPILFKDTVLNAVRAAHQSALGRDRRVTVFGEMVALLWEEGKSEAAMELERLWNQALSDKTFHLHCAYANALFENNPEARDKVAELHSHILENQAAA